MEARSVSKIPEGIQWQYEPKWDGFRCLMSRDGKAVTMLSKSGQDLQRYFPEIVQAVLALPKTRFALDGELIVFKDGKLSFDALLQRLHPAPSRALKLSQQTPALFLAFDILQIGLRDLGDRPLRARRPLLEDFAATSFTRDGRFRLSPVTDDLVTATRWLQSAGGGSDGVIAKRRDLPYRGGERDGMQKIKLIRSADCVIGGFRYGKNQVNGRSVVGSLLLGLYDDAGKLDHVGFTSGIKAKDKSALTDKLEIIAAEKSFSGKSPGGRSRWSSKESSEWQPVEPKLVVEVSYDHVSEGRFRHSTSLMRWRPDKSPRQCTDLQLAQHVAEPVALLSTGG
jgi:ATP-dependent DNA ligase